MEVTMSASAIFSPTIPATSPSSAFFADSAPALPKLFVQCLKKVPDPRSQRGKSHPFPTILAIVLLGLLANISTLAEIER